MIMVMAILGSSHIDVDKGTQAIVFAEVAAGVFIARGAIANVGHRLQADKRGLLAVLPQAQGLLRGANRTRLATVLVHDNLRHFALGAEARLDEIYFGLYHRQVVLRAALENEARPQRSQIGDAGNVEEYIFR